ncbi:MAG: ABC transporter permease [Actinomycetota bacterium]|nr:ABC transporter permease [Actinomycetota bacterium]
MTRRAAIQVVPLRVVESNLRRWRRTWHGSAFSSFVSPALFLAAMGLGLGSLVDRGGPAGELGGVSYMAFVGSGLLAATTFQNAAGESAWPVRLGIKWGRGYHAMIATPVQVRDIVLGQLVSVAIRLMVSAVIFAVVMTLFGVAGAGRSMLAVLPAVVTGMAISPPVVAYTSWIEDDEAMAYLFRFGIVPVFLLSGAFFPITELPGWLQPVALATPLWHGVELTRWVALGMAPGAPVLLHVGYLAVWGVAGTLLAVRLLRRKLTP